MPIAHISHKLFDTLLHLPILAVENTEVVEVDLVRYRVGVVVGLRIHHVGFVFAVSKPKGVTHLMNDGREGALGGLFIDEVEIEVDYPANSTAATLFSHECAVAVAVQGASSRAFS